LTTPKNYENIRVKMILIIEDKMNKDEIDATAEREGRALKKLPTHHTNGRGRINQRDTYGKDKFEKLFRS